METTKRREFGSLIKRGRYWYLRYRVDGKEHWESLKTTSEAQAAKKAAVIEHNVGKGEHTAPRARRLSFGDMEKMLLDSYALKGNSSTKRATQAIAHLRETFGTMRALAITADKVTAYEVQRMKDGASRATTNCELAVLRRMFRLAVDTRQITSAPKISTPTPRNARQGFFEPDDFLAVMAELPDYLQAPMQFAYLTGWRIASEVFALTWDRVDFRAGTVRLEPNTTKNHEGREFPFSALPALAALLERQRGLTDELEHELGRRIPTVFHRRGNAIVNHHFAWRSACDRAAHGGKGPKEKARVLVRPTIVGRIAHDFRRTAARNLEWAGVPRSVAMQLTGHRTESIYRRYAIVASADLRTGVSKLAAHMDPEGSKQAPKGAAGEQTGLSLVKNAS
ncbi:MAG TPA: tyrosine-type recombinase/integrase [Gemmatimonadaceae bacterium]|nr:tyrosine-type recombinase/integrase [Gemmatimonadaceae bacterium]